MFSWVKKLFKRKENRLVYIRSDSRAFKFEDGWVEIKPFTERNHIIFILYNFRGKTETEHSKYDLLWIELKTAEEIRDFMEWFDGNVPSMLYGNMRIYAETDYQGKRFIQVTRYGLYKTWQWSTVIDKSSLMQIKNHIRSNWDQLPYVVPTRQSIYFQHTDYVPLTNNV